METSFEGLGYPSLPVAYLRPASWTNVAITGQGAIDGNGEYWRPLKKAEGYLGTVEGRLHPRGGAFKRPELLVPIRRQHSRLTQKVPA